MSKQISDLNSAGTLAGTEEFATVQSGETKKSTPAQMADYVSTNMTNIEADSISFNSGADTLSNYETGSWTPSLAFVTVSYTSQSGTYERIGDTYFCKFSMNVSSLDTADTSGITIDGLPFAIATQSIPVVKFDFQDSTLLNFASTDTLEFTRNANTRFTFVNGAGGTLTYASGKVNSSGLLIGTIIYSV